MINYMISTADMLKRLIIRTSWSLAGPSSARAGAGSEEIWIE